MSRPRRSFSPEFKLRVVQEVDQGQSQAAVARKYELSPHLIPLWKKALSAGRFSTQLQTAAYLNLTPTAKYFTIPMITYSVNSTILF